jgi:hypothetical protein
MPEFRKILDVYQGYNFKRDKHTPVGFITKLTLGGTDLTPDQNCKDPTEQDVVAVAVLSDVLWETGVTDALYFSGQVSVTNKQSIAQLVYSTMVDILVVYQFKVFEYDPLAKKYFLCFHSNDTDMNGILEKKGEDLNLSVADDPSTQVQSPENYSITIGVKPQPSAQALQVAVGDGKNFAKAWGLKVG